MGKKAWIINSIDKSRIKSNCSWMLSKMQKKCSNIPAHNPLSRHTTFFSFFYAHELPCLVVFQCSMSSAWGILTFFSYTTCVCVCGSSLFFRIYLNVMSSRKLYKTLGVGVESYLCTFIGHLFPHSKYWPLFRLVHTTSSGQKWCLPWSLLPS